MKLSIGAAEGGCVGNSAAPERSTERSEVGQWRFRFLDLCIRFGKMIIKHYDAPMAYFEIIKQDNNSRARVGIINTAHGTVNTPAFLPIGTRGVVKAVTGNELKQAGAEIILANTYHLWQKPGDDLIARAGGLHKFIGWDGPIFTDSGGFQVYSLAKMRRVIEEGVEFRFDLDGRLAMLTPEKSVQIQANLGSDIALILDDFPGYPFVYEQSLASIERTTRWAERALVAYEKIFKHGVPINPKQKLWGIVQGANFPDLRERSAKDMVALGFVGFAIGGVAVGEPVEEMMKAVSAAVPHLPESAPRHLLGVGRPTDIVKAVSQGCDTFDCVIPTREARHGKLYVSSLNAGWLYEEIDIRLERYKEDFSKIDESCDCYLCQNHHKAYLRYLFTISEPLAMNLATIHNLRFYLKLMQEIRQRILDGTFSEMISHYNN